MRTFIGYLIVAAALAAAGGVLWRASDFERRVAAAERDLVTLRYQEASEQAAAPPPRFSNLLPAEKAAVADAAALKATADYWQGDYDAVAADPKAKMLAANAAFRAMRRDGGPWQAAVGRLDSIVKTYADVLREEPDNMEASFNFEYAVRLRAVLAQRKQPLAPFDAAASGLTIHGGAGAPPADGDTKKFKMIVPMRPDERQEAEKAGKGGVKQRKG
jgi:hypothetical protein